jgi:hypothetical protein
VAEALSRLTAGNLRFGAYSPHAGSPSRRIESAVVLIHDAGMTLPAQMPANMEENAHAVRKSVVNARSRTRAGMTPRPRSAATPKGDRGDNFSLDNNSATAA